MWRGRTGWLAPQRLSKWRILARQGELAIPVPVADDPFFAAVEMASESPASEQVGDWIEGCVEVMVVRLPVLEPATPAPRKDPTYADLLARPRDLFASGRGNTSADFIKF